MTENSLEKDLFAKKVIKYFLVSEAIFMLLSLILLFSKAISIAVFLTVLAIFISVVIFIWLFNRYASFPIVNEKRQLKNDSLNLQTKIKSETSKLSEIKKNNSQLFEDEKKSIDSALAKSQKDYVQRGMANTKIEAAKIPSIGPKLKEKLFLRGIVTAADISPNIRLIDGFGDSKSQTLLDWQRNIYDSFLNTKPTTLSDEELETIKRKYLKLQQENNTIYETAKENKQSFEQKLQIVQTRLQQLTHVSFGTYLSNVFASHKVVSSLIIFVLVLIQCTLGISTGTASIVAALPTPTFTSTSTLTSTATLTFTVTPTSTITSTPTITFTPTITDTPTITFTPQPTLPSNISACIPQGTERQTAQVVAITDGDTIDVIINNQIYRVRYIGIDTPERNELFYNQATAFNQTLVYGKTVTLVKDVSEVDQFDRLLRYVIVDNFFVNYELVREGYALATAYPPDTACSSVFQSTQNEAKNGQFGMWMPTPTPYIAPAGSGGATGSNCDASYPGVCIPPPPPDLDCKDIPYKRFQVLSPDPHGFDRDGDGIGCES